MSYLINFLIKKTDEAAISGELDNHLGFEKPSSEGYHNGKLYPTISDYSTCTFHQAEGALKEKISGLNTRNFRKGRLNNDLA